MDSDVARKEWAATQESGTPRVISTFYEELVRKMTGADFSRNDEGDLILWTSGTAIGIEVKGGNSHHSFRIREEQFERHMKRSEGFPYDGNFLYFCFSYTTRESRTGAPDGVRRCLLRQEVLRGRGPLFLIERTSHLWILPIQFLEGHRRSNSGESRAQLIEGEGIRVLRSQLKEFRKRLHEQPHPIWHTRTGVADLLPPRRRTKRISFKVTMFVPSDMPEILFRGITWD